MSYTTLQADVADYLHRTDLTAQIPGFISRAESFLFRELRIKQTEISVTGVTVGGYALLPADFGSVSRVSVSSSGSSLTLDYLSLAEATSATDAYPKYYSFESGQLRIWGTADGQAYTLYYVPAITALSDSNATNWLLDNAPELYLYASALEGARYIRDGAQVAELTGFVAASMESVRGFSERAGQPRTGTLQIKAQRG